MNTQRDVFGSLPDGREVARFTVTNSGGYELCCMSYGATLIGFRAPDREGSIQELTLGYDTLDDYLAGHPFFGSSVGRVCNRISGARFMLDGREIRLPANEGQNTLHGGPEGFHVQLWDAEAFQSGDRAGVLFTRTSPDGESGFPGTVGVTIVMSLTEANELEFEYRAETDAPTPLNLTNHAYWNLAGAPDLAAARGPAENARGPGERTGGAIGSHVMTIDSSSLLEVDEASLPTGRLLPLSGTPYDFSGAQPLAEALASLPDGVDHCYVLDAPSGEARGAAEPAAGDAGPSGRDAEIHRAAETKLAAAATEPGTGRRMEVWTSLPAIQFYTGNKLAGRKSRGAQPFRKHDALCLETQFHIDAVNRPEFPSIILQPGEVYEHRTIHRFSVA